MDHEQVLLEIKQLCGGSANVKTTKSDENILILMVKDRSLVELKKINRLDDVILAEFSNSRLKITLQKKLLEEKAMAKKQLNYEALAKTIVSNVGGKGNVNSLRHCITRVRFGLKDENLAKDDILKSTEGVISVVKGGGEYMVVIGDQVTEVYNAVCKELGMNSENAISNDTQKSGQKGNLFMNVLNIIMGSLAPAMNLICAGGILKGILSLLSMNGILASDSGMYLLVNGIGDAIFFFLPIILGYNFAKKIKGDPFLGLIIGAILCYPTLNGVDINIFGITTHATYTSSFLPVIAITAVAVPISKLLNKYLPKVVSGFLTPVITLLIVIPLGFLIIGPAVTILGNGVNYGINFVLNLSPIIGGALFGGLYQILVVFGIHSAILSFSFMNILAGTPDAIIGIAMFPCFAQIGTILAIYFRTKNQNLKNIALPAFVSGIFGITEPAIYGITLPRIKMFVISCIGAAVSGMIVMVTGTKLYNYTGIGVFSFLGLVNPDNPNYIAPIVAAVTGFVVSFIIAFVMFKEDKE